MQLRNAFLRGNEFKKKKTSALRERTCQGEEERIEESLYEK